MISSDFLRPHVIALFIPIIAIICYSPIGKAMEIAISSKYITNDNTDLKKSDINLNKNTL